MQVLVPPPAGLDMRVALPNPLKQREDDGHSSFGHCAPIRFGGGVRYQNPELRC
jgi:hypothetical protein